MSGPSERVVLDGSFEHWRAHARRLVEAKVAPRDVRWVDPSRAQVTPVGGLFGEQPSEDPTRCDTAKATTINLPRDFVQRLPTVACHSGASTWALCYRLLWRLQSRGSAAEGDLQPLAWDDVLDEDVAEFRRRDQAVRRDAHKMHAFVRFRRIDAPDCADGERFVAWHRPLHRIAEREASFFKKRFPNMVWSILTPHASVHWDTETLSMTDGVPVEAAPDADKLEELWLTYYGAIFNPARVKLAAMRAEMPVHHWETLPETAVIPQLLEDVPRRLAAMAENSAAVVDSAAPFVPETDDLEELRAAAPGCRGCSLCDDGTRVVFGEGPREARIVLLGEQPGDREEQAGRPFVGPAGQLLERAIAAAGLDRAALYLTNSVKHFRHRVEVTPAGVKRRLHSKPRFRMVSQCQPWLDAEMRIVQPEVLVCLGATAARAVFGPSADARELRRCGAQTSRYAPQTIVTYHPAAALRADDLGAHQEIEQQIAAALRSIGRVGPSSLQK